MDYKTAIFRYEQKRAYNTFTKEALIDVVLRKNEEIKKCCDKITELQEEIKRKQ